MVSSAPLRWIALITAGMIASSEQTVAQIVTRTRRTPTENWNPILALTIGGGVEFETNSQETDWNFPLLIEYNPIETVKLSLEPNFEYIDGKTEDVKTVNGFGDMEFSIEWEFLTERRYRPAFTALGIVKFPTASDADLGTPGYDYSIGLIVSKDFVWIDTDLTIQYTFSGDPEQQDLLEVTLDGEIPLNHYFDLELEVVTAFGKDITFGNPGSIGGEPVPGGGFHTEGTVGIAWHVNENLKLEQGVTLRDDGTWQLVFGWEYSFGGD